MGAQADCGGPCEVTVRTNQPPASWRWLALAAVGSLAGCVVNGVRPLDGAASDLRGDQAIVVVGVTVNGAWAYPRFGVILDQYDATAQAITGNCLSYNRLEASVPTTPAPARFFAYDVPAGHYVYSAFNGGSFAANGHAYQALPGHVVYVGNFVLGDNGVVTLRSDLAESQAAIAQALPNVTVRVEPAPVTSAVPARPFLCTP